MSTGSAIEWTDATWNPVTGCTEVSPGCDHCYARTFAERFAGTPGHYFEQGFDVQLRPDKLRLPLSWRRPRRVFVNSMSDLFHAEVPEDYLAAVVAVMAATPQHTYQILTKRHGRMRSVLGDSGFQDRVIDFWDELREEFPDRAADRLGWDWWPLTNVWVGVSVEDQRWADVRIPVLRDTPAGVRFLSCEPLLGPLPGLELAGIDWVIVGGESGPGFRALDLDWVREIRDRCRIEGVAFFFKQVGGLRPKAGGRLLDGRTWDQMPTRT